MAKGVWEMAIVGFGPMGEAIVNTFHYSTPQEAQSDGLATILAGEFRDGIMGSFVFSVTDEWQGYLIKATCVEGANLGQIGESDIDGMMGEIVGGPAPMQTTAIIKRRTATPGRKGRGRLFISPIPAANVSVDGRYTDLNNDHAQLLVALMAPLVLLESSYDPGLYDPVADVFSPLTSVVLSNISGVRRSRRVRFPN